MPDVHDPPGCTCRDSLAAEITAHGSFPPLTRRWSVDRGRSDQGARQRLIDKSRRFAMAEITAALDEVGANKLLDTVIGALPAQSSSGSGSLGPFVASYSVTATLTN